MRCMPACKHRPDGCFPTALGRQTTFSDTSILRIISFSHHLAVVYSWEFEASFDGWMISMTLSCYRFGNRCWELETHSEEVEIFKQNVLKSLNKMFWNHRTKCFEITEQNLLDYCINPDFRVWKCEIKNIPSFTSSKIKKHILSTFFCYFIFLARLELITCIMGWIVHSSRFQSKHAGKTDTNNF